MTSKKDSTDVVDGEHEATAPIVDGGDNREEEDEEEEEEDGVLLTPSASARPSPPTKVFAPPNSSGPHMTIKDLNALRLPQDFTATGGTKLTSKVPVRKASGQLFFRAHDGHRINTRMLHLKEEDEWYLVAPAFWDELFTELVSAMLVLCVTRQGTAFIWPIRLADENGQMNSWHQSALDASEIATSTWIRMKANRQLGGYDVFAAFNNTGEPAWPAESFHTLIDTAFRDRFIDRIDHPVIRRIRGEV